VLTTRRDKFLGCGVAQQQLPRSPTSKIHKSVGNRSSKPPRGSRAVVLLGSMVWRGHHWGGTSACQHMFNSIPPHNRRTSTHTHTHITHVRSTVPKGCVSLLLLLAFPPLRGKLSLEYNIPKNLGRLHVFLGHH
jgi:hypothetical protein